MKKLFSLIFTLAIVTIAFAQVQVNKSIQMMSGNNAERVIENVGDPVNDDDGINARSVQTGTLIYGSATLTGTTYAVTLNPVATGYAPGMVVNFKPDLINTSPARLDVNGLGPKLIKKNVTIDLAVGDIVANQLVSVMYDGTNFQLLAGGGNYIQNQTASDQNAGFRITGDGTFNGTGSVKVPAGNTAQRPTPVAGMIRYNTDTGRPEYYNGTTWLPFASSPLGIGGSLVETSGFRIHSFTSTGNFVVTRPGTVEVLIIAGGGGGGIVGGGGAGGVVSNASVAVTPQTYLVTVGNGGAGGTSTPTAPTNGGNSSFNSIVAIGGGFGGYETSPQAAAGGSGGGGAANGAGGAASQGNIGGAGANNGAAGSIFAGGGGGGHGSVGGNSPNTSTGGNGGSGSSSSITGTAVIRAAGGGGGSYLGGGTGTAGTGGSGIGGNGGRNGLNATSGAANTGSGGGGAGLTSAGNWQGPAGSGGSGIVIIKYAIDY